MTLVPTYWTWPSAPPPPHFSYASPSQDFGASFYTCTQPGRAPISCPARAPSLPPGSYIALEMIEAEPTIGDGSTSGGYNLANPRAPTPPTSLPIDFVTLEVSGKGGAATYTVDCGLPDPFSGDPTCGPQEGGGTLDPIENWHVDLVTTGAPILTEMEPQPPLDSDGTQPFNIQLRYSSSNPADWAYHGDHPLARYLFPLADLLAVNITHNFMPAHSYQWTELVKAYPYSVIAGEGDTVTQLMMVL